MIEIPLGLTLHLVTWLSPNICDSNNVHFHDREHSK